MKVDFKVEGGEELRRALRKMPAAFMDAMSKELSAIGKETTDAGAAAAPILTGELRGSATTKTKSKQGKRTFVFLGILQSAHAAAVHEGVFGGVRKQLGSFKWWTRLFTQREAAYEARVIGALKTLVEGGGK